MPTLEQAEDWYAADDPVHGFDHVLRVLRLALYLAQASGADPEIVGAAVLLHDAAGASPLDPAGRAQHELRSAEFAAEVLAKEGWPPARVDQVMACILSHRYRGDTQPQTIEAQVVFDADKLDVIGAFGVARTLAYAQQAGEPAYAPVSDHFLDTGERAPGEPHSAYHEYLHKLRHVRQRLHTEAAKAIADEREPLLHHFFGQMAREAEFNS